jgi:MFS family permease
LLGPVLGPVLGGIISEELGWRYVYGFDFDVIHLLNIFTLIDGFSGSY